MSEADTNNLAWAIDSALQQSETRMRRERIATAVMAGLAAEFAPGRTASSAVATSLKWADALIAELDAAK